MKEYLRTVAAYLTGWVIAQTFYNRVIRHWRDSDWAEEKEDIAVRVVDELQSHHWATLASADSSTFMGLASVVDAELRDRPYSVDALAGAFQRAVAKMQRG